MRAGHFVSGVVGLPPKMDGVAFLFPCITDFTFCALFFFCIPGQAVGPVIYAGAEA